MTKKIKALLLGAVILSSIGTVNAAAQTKEDSNKEFARKLLGNSFLSDPTPAIAPKPAASRRAAPVIDEAEVQASLAVARHQEELMSIPGHNDGEETWSKIHATRIVESYEGHDRSYPGQVVSPNCPERQHLKKLYELYNQEFFAKENRLPAADLAKLPFFC